ncbi:MAG: alpha/beta hydrolase [Candidatus Micropelagos sp.]|nr:alpha/beta hydrolase [Candidatus Micropelagos sp.]
MTSTKHLINDIANILDHLPDLMSKPLTAENYQEKRAAYGVIAADMAKDQPPIEGIETHKLIAKNAQDGFEVPVFLHRPTDTTAQLPCLLWIHGGGYILGSAESDGYMAKQLALTLNCAVAVVDYRLAPEHAYPAPLHDCYAALNLLMSEAKSFTIDQNKVAILGVSAGGGLAAGLSLLNRDEAGHDLCGQVLVYPMLDDTNIAPATNPDDDFFVWQRASNLFGWQSYLGELFGQPDIPAYAAAARAVNLSGLPKTFMVVGDLDLFAGEDILYAGNLIQAGVPTDLHVYAGVCHGFDGIAPTSAPAQRCKQEIEIFLNDIFG